VSPGVARIPILPRKVAAGVTVSAVARGGWAIAAVTLIVSTVGISDQFLRLGYGGDLAAPLGAIVCMLAAILVLASFPSWWTVCAFVVIGGISEYVFLHGVLDHHASLLPAALILVNRPAAALVLVGTVGTRPLPAIAWGIGGFIVGEGVTLLVCLQVGTPLYFGNGPLITLANYCAAYVGLALIQRAQRRRVPDFLRLRQESRRIDHALTREQREVAVLHDTVLNDLALVVNGPDQLDDRMRERMHQDVATLSRHASLAGIEQTEFVDANDASLRNQMMLLVSDFQWRGLGVEVTGDTGRVARMTPEAVDAAVGALRACLENVLRHSGVLSAEIAISTSDELITWTVSDAGHGFDLAAVELDRLGLRTSVIRRVESAGGSAKVYSTPGNGTSVLLTLPQLPPPESTPGSQE
jgi:signal transduction histidine kinase